MKIFPYIKRPGWYVLAVATLCGLVALIVYLAAGLTPFVQGYSPLVIVPYVLGAVFGAASIVTGFRVAGFCCYVSFMASLLAYVTSQINYIANVAVSIDGETLSGAFFVIVIFSVLALAGSIFAFATLKNKEVPTKEAI